MLTEVSWRAIAREWFWMLACYGLAIAPFGCELRAGGLTNGLDDDFGGDAAGPPGAGLFINEDTSDRLLIAGRDANDNAFFVFGTRDGDGNLAEIESISVRTADGRESFISFESGRPVHVQGADGSYVHIAYEEVSSERLTAAVELFDATGAETSAYTVDVDLEQTAAQVAELVSAATGRQIDTALLSDEATSAKDGTQRLRVTIFSPLFVAFVVPLVAAVALMTVILGQILVFLLEVVAAALQLVLVAVFSPLFLIAAILSDVVFRVEFVPLSVVFDFVPPEPVIILM